MSTNALRRLTLALILAGAPEFATSAPPPSSIPDASAVAAANPLLVLEQHRASIVQRIVADWTETLAALPSAQRTGARDLAEALWALRADRLLAASLAGSYASIEAILTADRDERAGAARTVAKALGDAAADLTYTPINPCRIVDTRNSGGPLAPNVARAFVGHASSYVTQGGTAGSCGLPGGVAAIAMNVYAINPTNLGFIKLWAANASEPFVSTVNYQIGVTAVATGTIVPVDPSNNDLFNAKSPATVDFAADVVGYFRAPAGTYFRQGGNSMGATAVVGTLDAFPLELYTGAARALRLEPNATSPNVVGGHPANAVGAAFFGQTVAGGGAAGSNCYDLLTNQYTRPCANQTHERFATVGGGDANDAAGYEATVGGGGANVASGATATIGGGFGNVAGGVFATIAGGDVNLASGQTSTIAGGAFNVASGAHATVGGGAYNLAAGNFSTALGYNAKAREAGMFVWADSRALDFDPTVGRAAGQSVDSFNIRATGPNGVLIATAVDATTGVPTWGCRTQSGAGWACTSDRRQKRNLVPVDGKAMLAKVAQLPIYRWQPKDGPQSDVLHVGPTAQDFHATFGLGDSATTIGMQDAEGVALAAIQGLHEELKARDREIAALTRRLEALAARLRIQ